jgi:hypothetical protein
VLLVPNALPHARLGVLRACDPNGAAR